MVEINPAGWFQNRSDHAANQMRMYQAALLEQGDLNITLNSRGGVVVNSNAQLDVTATGPATMSVDVEPGVCFVRGTENATQGIYTCVNDATKNLTIAAADAGAVRIDLVVARVRDAQYSGATNAWALEVVTGTPGAGTPATPSNSLVLAKITVGISVTTIVQGNIDETVKVFASAIGGIQQWPTKAMFDAGLNNSRQVFLDRAAEQLWYYGTFGDQYLILTERYGIRANTIGKKYTGTATLFSQTGTTEATVTNLDVGPHSSPRVGKAITGKVHCFVQSTVANDRVIFRVRDTNVSGVIRGASRGISIPGVGLPILVEFDWWFPSASWSNLTNVLTCQRESGTGTITIVGQGTTNPMWHVLNQVPDGGITTVV